MTIWHMFIPIVLFFGVWTVDRFVHLIWATVFFVGFLMLASGYKAIRNEKSLLIKYWIVATRPKGRTHIHAATMAIFTLFLGSWIPDIDWKFGVHRSPLTHSILPYLILWTIVDKFNFGDQQWNRTLLPIFGFALGSHLIIDFFQGGNLVSVPTKYEFAFYLFNGFMVCALSYFRMHKYLRKSAT